MDPAAIAETTVEMWALIDSKLTARNMSMLDPAIKAMMLKEAMALYMTNIINAKKHPPKPTADTPADADHCAKCGRELTQGEMGFLEGKMGEERKCYHCKKGLN